MKYTNKILGTMLVAMAVTTSCVDDDKLQYAFEKPASIAGYEYLDKYDALKSYESNNSKVAPDFKLGVALAATDYNANGLVTRLANSNFEEVVAGNEMKMASVVNDKGEMDFGTVENFVRNADEYGMNVYGHTLAWHAQQPVKWLNDLLKDKPIPIPEGGKIEKLLSETIFAGATSYTMWGSDQAKALMSFSDEGLVLTSTKTEDVFYAVQYMVLDGLSLKAGQDYRVKVKVKGNPANNNFHFVIGKWGTDIKSGSSEFGTDWTEMKFDITPSDDMNGVHLILQSGDYIGQYVVASAAIYSLESPAVETLVEDYEYSYKNVAKFPWYVMGYEPAIVNGCLHSENPGSWYQYFIADHIPHPIEGDYVATVRVKASKDDMITLNMGWGWGSGESASAKLKVTTEWTEQQVRYTNIPAKDCNLVLQPGGFDGTIDIEWVKCGHIVNSNTIPLTPEEKRDTLLWAMDKWIGGMMEACGGKVKAWDVVNEAVGQGEKDIEGIYKLQHGTEGDKDNFFWQDYLGDTLYVRAAVALAREYGPEDIKLFINDYNLESDWDNNNKVKSLIAWIKRWEADGATKIDGIGSQMHIWCYSNATVQESKKAAIVNMFKELAKSGKLVRISELDMGYTNGTTGNEEDNMVATANLTEEQHKQMAELYNWVIKQYFEIIPASQQWGICQWCITDSPASSGWRKNQPTGLWDLNYNRKHTYAGFATGIAGTEYEPGK